MGKNNARRRARAAARRINTELGVVALDEQQSRPGPVMTLVRPGDDAGSEPGQWWAAAVEIHHDDTPAVRTVKECRRRLYEGGTPTEVAGHMVDRIREDIERQLGIIR